MQISTRIEGEITVVDVSGSLNTLTSGAASEELAKIVQSNSKLLLNFAELEYLGSAGLLALLRTAKQLHGADGTLKICNSSRTVKDVMIVSGFDKLLDLCDSESEAVAMF